MSDVQQIGNIIPEGTTIIYDEKQYPTHIPDYTVMKEYNNCNPSTVQDSNILALKFDYGVAIAARGGPQLKQVGKHTIIAGTYGTQYLYDALESREGCQSITMLPREVNTFMAETIHHDGLVCDAIVVGMQDGEPYIGTADSHGSTSEDEEAFIIGANAHSIQPLIEQFITGEIHGYTIKPSHDEDCEYEIKHSQSATDAVNHIYTCLGTDKVNIAVITAEGIYFTLCE